jgi:hypothetical protein
MNSDSRTHQLAPVTVVPARAVVFVVCEIPAFRKNASTNFQI